MRIYSLFDRKLKEYGQLVLMTNDESVIRALRDVPSGGASMLEKYPEDFDLMCLGNFDPLSGVMAPNSAPRLVDNVATILSPNGGKADAD